MVIQKGDVSMMRNLVSACIIAVPLLSACAEITQPVAAISSTGVKMTGTATAKLSGDGLIVVSGPYGKCTGTYDSLDYSTTIPISLLCDDGTTALGSATRTDSGMSGAGTMRDSKGRDWQFVFGKSATALF